jgi:hypothetical protein
LSWPVLHLNQDFNHERSLLSKVPQSVGGATKPEGRSDDTVPALPEHFCAGFNRKYAAESARLSADFPGERAGEGGTEDFLSDNLSKMQRHHGPGCPPGAGAESPLSTLPEHHHGDAAGASAAITGCAARQRESEFDGNGSSEFTFSLSTARGCNRTRLDVRGSVVRAVSPAAPGRNGTTDRSACRTTERALSLSAARDRNSPAERSTRGASERSVSAPTACSRNGPVACTGSTARHTECDSDSTWHGAARGASGNERQK